MKNLLVVFLCFPLFCFAQENTAPPASLAEVLHIKVKPGMNDEFEEAVKNHNMNFHGEGLYPAQLFYVVNGPFGGMYEWVMAPTSYSALDARPDDEDHEEDWENVMEYVDYIDPPMYWTLDQKLSRNMQVPPQSKALFWIFDVRKGEYHRFNELLSKITAVYKETRPDERMIVIRNDFANNEGMDVGIIWTFEQMSFLDDQRNFSEEYEKVHGNDTWRHFLNDFEEAIDGRVDFLRYRVD